MFHLIGLFAVMAVLIPIALMAAFVCLAATAFKGAAWLAVGAVKFVIGLVFVAGFVVISLFVIPFALLFH